MLNMVCLYHRETQELRVSAPKKREIGKAKVVDPPSPRSSMGALGGVVGRRRFLSPFRRLCPTWVLARKPEGRKEGSVSPLIFTPIVSRPSLLFRPIWRGPHEKCPPPPPPPLFPDTSVEKRLGRRPQSQVGPRRRVRRARQTLFHACS